jgi:hypothetical protein
MGRDFSKLLHQWARALRALGAARRLLLMSPIALTMVVTPVGARAGAPGGFLETTTSTEVRPRITPGDMPDRGSFTFPEPYNTVGVRLTNSSDCGGNDCVDYIGYSYWRNTNNHVGSDTMLIFVTLDRARGGGGPTLYSYDKTTDQVSKVGPLFDPSSPLSWATGEGWYWRPTLATKLYVISGSALYRYDVNTRQLETVFDVTTEFPGRYIWQVHTSHDDKVHSATLRDGSTSEMLGCFVYSENTRQFSYLAKTGAFDECQVDKSGQWLLIKEQVDGLNGEDNVIVNLGTGQQTVFSDPLGAPGHSDNGFGYMVGEDNWYPLPGAARVWQFGQALPGVPPQGRLVYHTTDWSVDLGHLSHANAQAGVPIEQQYACLSHASRFNLPRANEIVCFRLDGSLQVLVVAPVMTDLNASGGGDDYSKLPKGNLDITGQYFVWTSNLGGNRLDAFIVKVPAAQLIGQTTTASPSLASAVLPRSRSVQLGAPVTALATLVASGTGTATGCAIAPMGNVPAGFRYQATDPVTNELRGAPNTPVNLAAGQSQTFVIAFTPNRAFSLTDIQLRFSCANTSPAPVVPGLNTLLLSASDAPVPDLVALAATLNNDGIVNIPGTDGTGIFSVATVNLGQGGAITATADTGDVPLPITIWLCQTNRTTGACLAPPSSTVSTQINPGETPTFGVFVSGRGPVPFDPAGSRINIRFKDGGNVTRGSTSVAVRTL